MAKDILLGLGLIAVPWLAIWLFVEVPQDAARREYLENRNADAAVELLPPETLARYREHMHSRTRLLVRQLDAGLLVETYDPERGDDLLEVTRFVPSNAPYFLTCESDVQATFASGGELIDLHFTDGINPLGHPPSPELGVPYNSVAASSLFDALCDDARSYLQGLGFVELDMLEVIGRSAESQP
ncbi:MAG: hypothetical protein JNL81_01260 [Hyphomonadaceae bacterium]|nr:hypothetical protein [Hyphomonadaceae bacterium]